MQPVVWLRAWFRYLRQTGSSFGLVTIVDALRRAPNATRALIGLFVAAARPGVEEARRAGRRLRRTSSTAALAKVRSIDDDRILRRLRALVDAIVRTNAFAPAADEALAFKINSSMVPGLPRPVPWREIWVYSPRVEGIHLRGGPVARGGIRWSDRRDDFRTEILGLMKAQLVKNAVIVPTGAKGGFYPKQLPPMANRDALARRGDRELPDLHPLAAVDHRQPRQRQGRPPRRRRHPRRRRSLFRRRRGQGHRDLLRRRQRDRAGAQFLARRRVRQRRVERLRPQGDGDHRQGRVDFRPAAFPRNGHRRSVRPGDRRRLRRHVGRRVRQRHAAVEVDPAARRLRPSPYLHRSRLPIRQRAGTSASACSTCRGRAGTITTQKLISKGGGILPRTEKSIPLSAEARAGARHRRQGARPGEPDQRDPEEPGRPAVVRRHRHLHQGVDAEPGRRRRSRPTTRFASSANELRAKVIGEGANLGITQAGRIEFAERGGRINTDFIDNSAGVDCSDNEVNIKIPLNREMREGRLAFDKRNACWRR